MKVLPEDVISNITANFFKFLTKICYKINPVLLKIRLITIMIRDLRDKSRGVEKKLS